MTELLPNIFAIQVPTDSFGFETNKKNQLGFWENVLQGSLWQVVDLPGNYSFICASLNLTEDEAAAIVEYEIDITGVRAKNYRPGAVTICLSCVESLRSLLSSKGLNPQLNYAILRKQF